MTLQELLGQALKDHQNGQFDRAERGYRTILGKNPKHGDALNLLGMLLAQTGRDEEGAEMMRRAIAIAPNFAPLHANLGETYRRQKKFDLALATLNRAIQLDPRFPEAHNNLAATLGDMGRWDESLAAAQRAIALRPGFAGAEFNLGNSLSGLGRHQEAIDAFQRALAAQPGFVDALINLGTALQNATRIDEAIAAFAEATRLKPDSADAFNNLAVVLEARGRSDEAMAAYATAVTLNPRNYHAKSNLGFALAKLGRLDEAMELCQSAASSTGATADMFVHLGFVYREKQDLAEAMKCNLQAVERNPNCAAAHNAIGNIYKDMGQIKEAIASFRRAVELKPEEVGYFSNLVYTLNFDADCSPARLLAEHKAWAARHCYPYRKLMKPHANDRNPERRIRIGYVSPDFRMHPVGRFILPLLSGHDHSKFEVYCYASVKKPDSVTDRMHTLADVWRDVRGISNIELSEIVRRDQIDILVDLTMHMADNRLTLFAYKPAPVQVTYLAYAGTTGMDTIDYRVTDPWLDPTERADEFYSEKSVRPGVSYWCYEAPLDNLPLNSPPLLRNGYVTFGCLNNFCKISREVLQTWCRILKDVPRSRLMIHAQVGAHRDRVREIVSASGLDANGLSFVEALPLAEYMATYGQIDISLDPFPYVGGTTTCDAMWMGVPVVTLSGETAISRGGVSIMRNAGLPELVARSADEYLRIAVELANDRPRLEAMRSALRNRMKSSPLMDVKRFVGDMEAAFRQIWRQWCTAGSEEDALQSAMEHLQANHVEKAEAILRHVLQKQPADSEAMRLLGVALSMGDKVDEGIALLRKSSEIDPQSAVARVNLGWAMQKSGRFDEAIAEYREAVRLKPDSTDTQYNLGFALASRRRLEEAIGPLREGLRLQPRHALAAVDLCTVLRELGRVDDALPIAREAARTNPQSAEVQNMLGVVLAELMQAEESAASLREAVRLNPDLAAAWGNLARALADLGELDEAVASYRRAIELKPDLLEAHTGLAFTVQYHADFDAKQILEQCRRCSQAFEPPLKEHVWPHLNDRTADRRLRVGYVSPDFREHPVGRFMLPLLHAHNHQRFEIYAYSSSNRCDALTGQLRNACDHWREIRGLSDDDTAELIRRDGIDVLIDLAMHTSNNRLLVFARKPAPVQATWLAYPGTTGLQAMDYRISDPYLDSPGFEDRYSEKTIRLRDTYWCFQPTIEPIDPGPPPLVKNGYVTFGNLNNFSKISRPTLELWARVFQRLKYSRLLMLSPPGKHREKIRQFFSERQIDPSRIDFVQFQPRQKYLETYRRIDLGLDTIPYNGPTTAFDAMWMGVPVITRVGRTVVGRGVWSLLNNLGLQQLASDTDDGLVNIAVDLAENPARLQRLRQTLRSTMQASPLMDAQRFARSIEDVYRQMWTTWCERGDDSAEGYNRLGKARRESQPYEATIGDAEGGIAHLDASIAALEQAITLKRDFADAHLNLGNALKDTGRVEDALKCYRRAIDVKPDFAEAYHALAFASHFHPEYDSAGILAECRRWSERFERKPSATKMKPKDHSSNRRLKVAYIGNTFCQHSNSLFTIPLLSNHNRSKFEIFCYSDIEKPDRITDRIRRYAEQWRPIFGLAHDAVAKQIESDGIDILIDTTMHMPDGRLEVFALRPAPIQATWIAYPGTTGMKSMDYRLTDPYLDPPGGNEPYTEKTIRLPNTFWCYDPMCDEIDPGALPMTSNGFVTFGNLNNFCKLSDVSLDLWARVLAQVQKSRLLLLAPRGKHRDRIRNFFAERKIDGGRIEVLDHQPRRKYLEIYQRIDLGIDTLPYNGHTTSLDSMWMGVPVVTRIGWTVVGRAGFSQLSNVDLTELAGESDDAFVQTAAELAQNRTKLKELRSGLRSRMKVSPLMDAQRFARGMEDALLAMWQECLANLR